MVDRSKMANYPLLLIYGEKDHIVDKKGCDELFSAWKSDKKKYVTVPDGGHGRSTVTLSKKSICDWINEPFLNSCP